MNPIGFAATAVGVYWAVISVLAILWPIPGAEESDTLARQLTSAVGPYVHYGLLGIAMHLGLRWLGSRRSAIGSIGVSFFAAGSVGTAAALLWTATARWLGHVRGTGALELGSDDPLPLTVLIVAVMLYALVCLTMVRGMMGLHRTALWKAILAAAFAMVVTALLFGSVLPEGSYGWRPYIRIDLGGGFDVSFGFQG
jgi:hypothetical protein